MKIHIIGICGIGMSAIAQILHKMGYEVQGSDIAIDGFTLENLRSIGIRVVHNHSKENIKDADLVIKSTAIKDDNPEVIASKLLGKKVFTRIEALTMLLDKKRVVAISGAHGKSTSTAMVYSILESALFAPSLLCGAIVNSISNNAKLGKSDIFVLEADESDGSFSKIPYFCGALTNIDFEHLDYYGNFENLINHYRMFIRNVGQSGMIAVCRDDEKLFHIADSMYDKSCIVYYAIDNQAEIRATNIYLESLRSRFDVEFYGKLAHFKALRNIELNLPGKHNIYNALVAISIATKFSITEENIKFVLSGFLGLKRRFTILGKITGTMIIDDYGHHPTEIMSTIDAARNIGRVICVIQPHRFTRVKTLFEEYVNLFDKVHYTFLLNVYPAGEKAIENCSSIDIVGSAKAKGMNNVELISNEKEVDSRILSKISSGDVVIFFGAGNITDVANNFFANTKSVC